MVTGGMQISWHLNLYFNYKLISFWFSSRTLPQNILRQLYNGNSPLKSKRKQKQQNMKVKSGFRLTEVCGQYILIAEGKENIDYSNIISMNESSKLLWDCVQGKDFTIADLAQILMNNYQLDDKTPLPQEQANADAAELAREWIEAGIITE